MFRAAMLEAFTAHRRLEICAGEAFNGSQWNKLWWVTAELWLRWERSKKPWPRWHKINERTTARWGLLPPPYCFPLTTAHHLTSLCPAPPLAQPFPPPPPLSPPLLETVFKQKNAVVCSEGCACRLMPTPGFSRRPVLFLALISGCWKFGNRCLKPCKRF